MADITIHGVDDRIIARLQQDADAQGISLEGMIRHVLSQWEELKNTSVYVAVESKDKLPMGTFEPLDGKAAFLAGVTAAERGEPCPPYPTPPWVITADHTPDRVQDEEAFRGFFPSLAGMTGPDDCTLKPEEFACHPLAKPFRLTDECGVIREGFVLYQAGELPPTLDAGAEPWHTISGGKACTVEVFQDGVWQKSLYRGITEG
jgi:hypothetical protein